MYYFITDILLQNWYITTLLKYYYMTEISPYYLYDLHYWYITDLFLVCPGEEGEKGTLYLWSWLVLTNCRVERVCAYVYGCVCVCVCVCVCSIRYNEVFKPVNKNELNPAELLILCTQSCENTWGWGWGCRVWVGEGGEVGEKGEGPYLGQWHALWGPAVQHDHALKRHLGALGVLLKVLPQVWKETAEQSESGDTTYQDTHTQTDRHTHARMHARTHTNTLYDECAT